MGMKSHVLLVLILQGKRKLTLKQVPVFAKGLGLSTPERLYFQALIQFENADTEEEKDLCRLWLDEVNPGGEYRVREIDEYIVIAHWVHMAILAMTELKQFKGSVAEIKVRLGDRVSTVEIRQALDRLFSLGLLKEENGQWICTAARVTTKDDVANKGAREYHKQICKLAAESIESQNVDEREFQSFALSIPEDKIPLAKELIRKFRTQFCRAMGDEPGDHVYQTQIQFFRLTESPSKMVSTEDEGAGSMDKNMFWIKETIV